MPTSPFLDENILPPAPPEARYIWAKVTQSTPLRIQVDGDQTPLPITPDDMGTGLRPLNQRVYCQILNRRLVVLGPINAQTPAMTALSTEDLDDLTIGEYSNSTGANITLARHYPEAGVSVRIEHSERSDRALRQQIARPISASTTAVNAANRFWVRNYSSGAWGSWYLFDSRINDVQRFTSSGTWTMPTGARRFRVICQGPGGGGGGASSGTGNGDGGGGGGGGYTEKWYDAADLSATEAVTVGTGGVGVSGVAGNAGSAATTFKGMSAGAGSGGGLSSTVASPSNAAAAGGAGGTATGGDINIPGKHGSNGRVINGAAVLAGQGGDSVLGKGGVTPTTAGSRSGVGYGSGGSGYFGGGTAGAGGTGASGIVIVESYF